MTHRVWIIEDEQPAARRLCALIRKYIPGAKIEAVLTGVDETVSRLQAHGAPDLMFLDIQLADGKSFEIFSRVVVRCPVIFVTAYDTYALQAFEVNGMDYLLKPIDEARFHRAIERYLKHATVGNYKEMIQKFAEVSRYKVRFLVKHGDEFVSVPADEVAFFRFQDGYIEMRTRANRRFFIDDSIEQLSRQLDPARFFRINRGTILHIDAIVQITPWFNSRLRVTTRPATGEDIIVSRDRVKAFKAFLNR